MNEPKRVSFWLIIGAMLVAIFIVFEIRAQQNDDHGHGQAHHGNDGELVVVEQAKRSVGVGLSGSDMDINDCLATHSILFGLWQGTHTNPYCEAARMDRDGNYLAAAELRCSTRKYEKVYGKGQECINAVIRSAPVEATEVLVGQVPDDDARYDELLERLNKYENERQQANRSYTAQQQVQQQQYEEIKQIETARKRKIELIREEFGSEQATETDR